MQFTATNLKLVEWGLQELQAQLQNKIVTCPDPDLFKADLQELHGQKRMVDRLLGRIDLALYKEAT